jgi:Holliday junction resolvase RusA-like endonuclease
MVKGGVLGDDRQIVSLTITKAVADTDGALIRMMRV